MINDTLSFCILMEFRNKIAPRNTPEVRYIQRVILTSRCSRRIVPLEFLIKRMPIAITIVLSYRIGVYSLWSRFIFVGLRFFRSCFHAFNMKYVILVSFGLLYKDICIASLGRENSWGFTVGFLRRTVKIYVSRQFTYAIVFASFNLNKIFFLFLLTLPRKEHIFRMTLKTVKSHEFTHHDSHSSDRFLQLKRKNNFRLNNYVRNNFDGLEIFK